MTSSMFFQHTLKIEGTNDYTTMLIDVEFIEYIAKPGRIDAHGFAIEPNEPAYRELVAATVVTEFNEHPQIVDPTILNTLQQKLNEQ